jgi:OOP family OmpA-OmpF porin
MKITAALLITLLPASVALAQGALFPKTEGWYGGGGLTYSEAYTMTDWYEVDGGDPSFGFTLNGGYQFSDYFAIELGYINSGTQEYSATLLNLDSHVEADISVQAIQSTALLIWPLSSNFELYVRAGGAYWKADSKQRWTLLDDDDSTDKNISATDFSGVFGVGAGVTFNRNWHVRFEVQDIRLSSEIVPGEAGTDASLESWIVQVQYRFW